MSDNRKNLKVDPETYERLVEGKPAGVTWDRYLRNLADSRLVVLTTHRRTEPPTTVKIDGVNHSLVPGERRVIDTVDGNRRDDVDPDDVGTSAKTDGGVQGAVRCPDCDLDVPAADVANGGSCPVCGYPDESGGSE